MASDTYHESLDLMTEQTRIDAVVAGVLVRIADVGGR